jgi:hypothetical protein
VQGPRAKVSTGIHPFCDKNPAQIPEFQSRFSTSFVFVAMDGTNRP